MAPEDRHTGEGGMIEFNVREITRAMEAQSASAAAAAALHLPAQEGKRTLGPLASAVAQQKFAPALARGARRIRPCGRFPRHRRPRALVYAIYVVPLDGFEWHYVTTILAIATTAVFAFQWADIYEVGAFRSRVEQLSRIGLSLTIVFLFVLAVAFFAKYQACTRACGSAPVRRHNALLFAAARRSPRWFAAGRARAA
jgi:hypothetical protein